MRFDTPLQIFGFAWQNSFSLSDRFNDFPSKRVVVDVNDTTQKSMRVYERTYLTEVNWETNFSLPSFCARHLERVAVRFHPEGGSARAPRAIRAHREHVRRQLIATVVRRQPVSDTVPTIPRVRADRGDSTFDFTVAGLRVRAARQRER